MERIVDELLTNRHTLRLATVGPDGTPHVVPLWFVSWKGRLYMLSVTGSLKTAHIGAGTRAAAVVDEGPDYPLGYGPRGRGRSICGRAS